MIAYRGMNFIYGSSWQKHREDSCLRKRILHADARGYNVAVLLKTSSLHFSEPDPRAPPSIFPFPKECGRRPYFTFMLAPSAASKSTTKVLASDARFPRYVLGGTHVRVLSPASDGRRHSVFVGFPYSYDKNPDRLYPAFYLCDGFWDFAMIVGFYGNLLWEKVVPEFFVIGLSYEGDCEHPKNSTWRYHDYLPFLPPHIVGDSDTNWNSTEYHRYLKEVIIPFVEGEYSIDPRFRVLGGCSIGALFALSAMLRDPMLFQGVIALNPPVGFGERWIFREEQQYFEQRAASNRLGNWWKKTPGLPVSLFLSTAEQDPPSVVQGITELDRIIGSRAYRGLQKRFRVLPEEGHGASKAAGYSRGLRFAFAEALALYGPGE